MGFIFTQMEEPGFMLSIAFILGLAWQERQLKKQIHRGKREKEFPNYQLPITNSL